MVVQNRVLVVQNRAWVVQNRVLVVQNRAWVVQNRVLGGRRLGMQKPRRCRTGDRRKPEACGSPRGAEAQGKVPRGRCAGVGARG